MYMFVLSTAVHASWAQNAHPWHWIQASFGRLFLNPSTQTRQKTSFSSSSLSDSGYVIFFATRFAVFFPPVFFPFNPEPLASLTLSSATFRFLFALSSSMSCFFGVSVRIAVFRLFLPPLCPFLGPALGRGRIASGVSGSRIEDGPATPMRRSVNVTDSEGVSSVSCEGPAPLLGLCDPLASSALLVRRTGASSGSTSGSPAPPEVPAAPGAGRSVTLLGA